MMQLFRSVSILITVAALTGCAVGNKHQYAEAVPALKVKTEKSIALGVLDKRREILNKTKAEDFVGVQRGGFGNPFDVTTVSGKPLATEMSAALSAGLRQNAVKTHEMAIPSSLEPVEAARQITRTGSDRGLLMTLLEWKADTMTNTALHYNVRLSVLDASGQLLTQHEVKGKDDLGGSLINPPEHAKTVVPAAFKAKMESLFAAPDVASALR